MIDEKSESHVSYISSLKGHVGTVNCVRFSPDSIIFIIIIF